MGGCEMGGIDSSMRSFTISANLPPPNTKPSLEVFEISALIQRRGGYTLSAVGRESVPDKGTWNLKDMQHPSPGTRLKKRLKY